MTQPGRAVIALLMLLALIAAVPAGWTQTSPEFSEAIARRLLDQVQQGLVANNPDQMLSAFDASKMHDYAAFRNQVLAMFARYESFRAAYSLDQVWTEAGRGIVLVDFELDADPRNESSPPLRRSGQVRFEIEHTENGWKIVELSPREFFS